MPNEFSLVKDFAVIMAVAGGALVLFRRLGQPAILGYLVAGLIVGPFTLPNPPVRDQETIRLLADLGLVLLLFGLGLELGWERIRQVGLRVMLIGLVEMSFMVAIGYELGTLLGWDGTEAIFLGSAMAISSSAVLVKMLRDTGRLHGAQGRLIVGILVVEDLAAVILLSVLSGVATTGTADLNDIGALAGKLALFALSALVLGGLLAPRLIKFVAQFQSRETLLIASLALCFGLAVVSLELGISAAAGAFLMGAVLGDSEHAEEMAHTMSPIRDMFAALFFVSIGMLVDLSQIAEFIGPALAVSAVFILGKIVANTVGTFLVGHDGRTSLSVGMGMPQIGEFSLAMVKVGTDRGAIGGSLYPVVTVTTAITALLYPFIFRSANATADFLERRAPALLKRYVANLAVWLRIMRNAFNWEGELGLRIRRSGRTILVNMGIILVLFAAGTFALRISQDISELVHLPENTVGLIVSGGVLALSLPPALFMWGALRTLAEDLSLYVLARGPGGSYLSRRGYGRLILRDSMVIFVTALVGIWSLPLVSRLFTLGGLSLPIAIALVVVGVALMVRTGFRLHAMLEATLARTFLGQGDGQPPEDGGEKS